MISKSLWSALMGTGCLMALACGWLQGANTESQRQRAAALEGKLLAPCCYKEPVSRHQSEVALHMRLEIARSVEEGKSDAQIIDAYVQQYGAKVLANFAPTPGWAHLIPWVAALAGAMALSWWIRRMVRAHATSQA